MMVYTTAPALQFYSGNYLAGTPSRGPEPYADWQGLALESELLPDSPNHPEWPQPDCILHTARVRQPDRVSVYSVLTICRYMPDDASLSGLRAIALLKPPPLKDKIATLSSQEPYTAPLFSLWLCVSIAANTSRQYNENYYHYI